MSTILFGRTQQATQTPFDPVNMPGYSAFTDVQSIIEALYFNISVSASPPFSFGRSGVANPGTFLQCETVPSNISGRWCYLDNASIVAVFATNELAITWSLEVLSHDGDGINLASLGVVTYTATRGGVVMTNFAIPKNKQIAVRVHSGSSNPKNIVCGLQLTGQLT